MTAIAHFIRGRLLFAPLGLAMIWWNLDSIRLIRHGRAVMVEDGNTQSALARLSDLTPYVGMIAALFLTFAGRTIFQWGIYPALALLTFTFGAPQMAGEYGSARLGFVPLKDGSAVQKQLKALDYVSRVVFLLATAPLWIVLLPYFWATKRIPFGHVRNRGS